MVGAAFLLIPLIALLIRAPWRGLGRLLSDPDVFAALRLSLECASIATVISLVVGVPLAWVLARVSFPGRRLLRALVTLPLVLPPVVGGLALLLALGRNGVIGQYLDSWFGITLPFTTAGVVVAETFVALPFLVVTVEGAFRSFDRDLEEAAAVLPPGRGSVRARRAVDLADERAESPPESVLRVLLRSAGLAPVPQYVVRDAEGRFVARVDLAFPELRVAVEYDGAWHGRPGQLARDRRRLNALVAAGWTVVHLTAADMHAPDRVVTSVTTLLRERGLIGRQGRIKVLARGDISKALTVHAHKFSGKAAEKIAAAGGRAETLQS